MRKRIVSLFAIAAFGAASVFAQSGYQKPPQAIEDVLNAPGIPATSLSPARDKIVLLEPLRYPPISELAQPMLRLAGLRINPNTNGQHRQPYSTKLTLKNINDGKETAVQLPANAQIISPTWSADGKYIAFGNQTPSGIELWVVETASAKAKKINGVMVNTVMGGFDWMPDQKTLIVNTVSKNRGASPAYQNIVPLGPSVQEGSGKGGAVQTVQDLLKSPNDEDLFTYYATSQLAAVGVDGKIKTIGSPAIFDTVSVSPDGQNILVSRVQKPYSYLYPVSRFPEEVEVWDTNGKMVYKVASSPLQDKLQVGGVQTGPRSYGWIPTEKATLIWAEALDGGVARSKVTPKDKIVKLAAPFSGAPVEIVKTEQRSQGRAFGERDGLMLFYDYNRDTQHRRIFSIDYRNPGTPKMIADLNTNDRYGDIGQPVTKQLPSGERVIAQSGDYIFLNGAGASPEGDRPFFRKMDLKTGKTEEIFRSTGDKYESFVAMLDDAGTKIITRSESLTTPPNLFVGGKAVTNFTDPSPALRGITKRLVRYKRGDGVDMSFTLYLPPNYKEGTKLPTLVWAYPLEYTDNSTAGQVTGSTNRFTQIGGISHLFLALQGYAILDNATMPIVGNPETVNDTFVKQVVDSAQAAIDKAVELGVTDRDRVAVGGHSYGAFMTANLLAHSNLFRAGIARSGAYNRTLTPFGFQSEQRSFWEAPEMYMKVSPFMYANKIKDPILLIHGEADNNQGTFPIQSERLYAAIRGNGGTARLVMLPLEAHGYAAKESTEHTLYEMVNWLDKYVKNAPPRDNKQTAQQ